MSFHHLLLTYIHPFLQAARKIAVIMRIISPNRLRVLIYHDIPKNEENAFEAQLIWLKKRWNIVTPNQFELMISGNKLIVGDNVLITFDDGLISNRIIAENVLNPMGIQAIFFVISDFVSIEKNEESREFIAKHIIPKSKVSDIPEQWDNMHWGDLQSLIEQGHTIGCHTRKHTRLSNCSTNLELQNEIVTSADYIQKKLGVNIEHFAFTFGDIDSFSESALNVAKKRFRYIHSGIRGNNSKDVNPASIRRDAAAHQLHNYEYMIFKNTLLDSFLCGFSDFRYSNSRNKIDKWSED